MYIVCDKFPVFVCFSIKVVIIRRFIYNDYVGKQATIQNRKSTIKAGILSSCLINS